MTRINNTQINHFETLKNILGKKYIKGDIERPLDFIYVAKKGVSAQVINNFQHHFNFSSDYVADLLNISVPTVYRWVKANKNLDRNYSVQLFELTFLFLIGTEVFKNQDDFFKWLNLPNIALGGMQPSELLEFPNGVSKVRDLIGRIEHGVYS